MKIDVKIRSRRANATDFVEKIYELVKPLCQYLEQETEQGLLAVPMSIVFVEKKHSKIIVAQDNQKELERLVKYNNRLKEGK